jgi:hypothetical protein
VTSPGQGLLARILVLLDESGGQVTVARYATASPDVPVALLLGTAVFASGHRLSFSLVVSTTEQYARLLKYSFHLMDGGGATVFRYDMTPRHAGVRTFPHHKHVGADERVIESGPPDIEAIIAEVQAHVEAPG